MTSSGQQIITTHKYPGPILESKGMDMIFPKKSNKVLKKDKILENLGKNVQNLKSF